jgi:uncharacterized protein YdeI (YjbR/CyaY-like superfamily)
VSIPRVTIRTLSQLRSWFKEHHASANKVFLISYKRHTGKPFLTHRQQMEEAICWGWIDTTVKRVDEDRYGRTFVKRGPNGKWSTNTISYAKEMIAAGRMQPSGLRAYKHGLTKPIADSSESKRATMPPELKVALANENVAKKHFEQYPPSLKRTIYTWINRAKLPATKEKRISSTLSSAREGKRPL